MAKVKQKQKLIVGLWTTDTIGSSGHRMFVPNPKQPPETMTEINEIVAWAKKEFDGEIGSYEFIRAVPGSLECFQQTVMDFVVELPEAVDGK